MNSELIESIANAVLYEGYMLYPYRPSAVKNRQRWNFGIVYPKSYSGSQQGENPWFMQTECLIRGAKPTMLQIKVRFLQAVSRQMGKRPEPDTRPSRSPVPDFEIVESLEVGNKVFQSWQEAVERDVALPPLRLTDLSAAFVQEFTFSGSRECEPLKDDSGSIAAFIVRTRETVTGRVEIRAASCGGDLVKLTVLISNLAQSETPPALCREQVLLQSLLSAHTVMSVTGGEFISLMDPPPTCREVASECKNIGTWPVLVGDENARDAMLSSPIILYDYPQIAPESPGDLFDGTEIDEILALRILTLSDDEKREIRQTDDRAREILERTESMPMEHFLKLHGVLRGIKVADETGDPGQEDGR